MKHLTALLSTKYARPLPGLPTDNDYTYCKHNMSDSPACYFYHTTGAPYATAKANCQALGGNLVSWTSDEEQVGAGRCRRHGHEVLCQLLCQVLWAGLVPGAA